MEKVQYFDIEKDPIFRFVLKTCLPSEIRDIKKKRLKIKVFMHNIMS